MARDAEYSLDASEISELVRRVRARTPARLLAGRAGAAYRTNTQLELREAHAAARDAVRAELDLRSAFGAAFIERWRLFELCTQARAKEDYLLRPDLGRHFDDSSRSELKARALRGIDLQIAIGDGLSVPAVTAQVPALLPLLEEGAKARGWKMGGPFVIRHCRVGILNEVGEFLDPRVAVLLIGERPGLATAESLSAYMAYRPRAGHTDADRNLISNIHARGLNPHDAAARILNFAAQMAKSEISGSTLREELARDINPKGAPGRE
jgi:ethanolamine ammonia-lyase small subunit